VSKGFICCSPASSGGKSLGMQGTVSSNHAVPTKTLKTVPDCIVCVFPCSLISLLTRIQVILLKVACTKNILCLQKVIQIQKLVTSFMSHISSVILSLEQSQLELMVTLKSLSLADNAKRSASLNYGS
jgi:hypothetical protein